MKVGVFGGSFDPIHEGHLRVAEEAKTAMGLDSVILMPAGQPWLKTDGPLASGKHRLKMIELAIQFNQHLTVSDLELRRKGPTYTADTLEELTTALGPKARLYFIVGLDALKELEKWNRPQRVLELATLVGVVRPGHETLQKENLEKIRPGSGEKVIIIDNQPIEVSSTQIRNNVSEGQSITGHVTKAVEKYIADNRLYCS